MLWETHPDLFVLFLLRGQSALDFLLPAEFLDEFLCSGGDVAGEVNGVDALEDDVVGLHGVGPGEGRGASE